MNRQEQIYGLMTDRFDIERFPELDIQGVVNAFADGLPCAKLYGDVYNAKCRLEERLGVEEDEDVGIIINSLLEIAERLSMKMYEYGREKI